MRIRENMDYLLSEMIERLEYPSSWCLCHYWKIVDSLRIYILEKLKVVRDRIG